MSVVNHIDPLAAARLRGFYAQRRLLEAEGGALTVAEMSLRTNISQEEVDQLRRDGKLMAICLGAGDGLGVSFVYPAWQVNLPGFDQVVILTHSGEVSLGCSFDLIAFMLNRNARLEGERPIDVLRRGGVDQVLRAVKMYGEHSAI